MGRTWVLGGGALVLLGCSSLLGLDDFQDAPGESGGAGGGPSGGAAGAGGSNGGSAGAGGAPTGGGGASSGGSGGAPSGGSGGAPSGGGGSGGTGGASPPITCSPIGSAEFAILPAAEIPGKVSDVVAASDPSGQVHVIVAHEWTTTPPSGRNPYELVAMRLDDLGKPKGAPTFFALQAPFTPAFAAHGTSPTPKMVVYGWNVGVSEHGLVLNSSGAYTGAHDVKGILPQSKCTNGASAEHAAFSFPGGNEVRFAASCWASAAGGVRELFAGLSSGSVLVMQGPNTDDSLLPRAYWHPQSGTRILLTQNGFRVGSTAAELANPPVHLDKGAADSQTVLAMAPRTQGVLTIARRVSSGGQGSLWAAALTDPYTNLTVSPAKDIGGPLPPPNVLHQPAQGPTLSGVTGTTPPDGSGNRHVRLILWDATGAVKFNDDVHAKQGTLGATALAFVNPSRVLVAWNSGPTVSGVLLNCQ